MSESDKEMTTRDPVSNPFGADHPDRSTVWAMLLPQGGRAVEDRGRRRLSAAHQGGVSVTVRRVRVVAMAAETNTFTPIVTVTRGPISARIADSIAQEA